METDIAIEKLKGLFLGELGGGAFLSDGRILLDDYIFAENNYNTIEMFDEGFKLKYTDEQKYWYCKCYCKYKQKNHVKYLLLEEFIINWEKNNDLREQG